MKHERIDLIGGYYINPSNLEIYKDLGGPYTEIGKLWHDSHIKPFVTAINKDAARVQILAKALRDCMEWMESTRASGDAGFWDWSENSEYTKAEHALKEAELEG